MIYATALDADSRVGGQEEVEEMINALIDHQSVPDFSFNERDVRQQQLLRR